MKIFASVILWLKTMGIKVVIYMNRYYKSVQLFKNLHEQQTLAVGICISNRRGLQKDVDQQKLASGET